MNKVQAIHNLNDSELQLGIAGTSASWHEKYHQCHFIYVGGLPTEFTEGDLLAMFEQYGIVTHVNLLRDGDTGKSRGFAFLKYHNPRSAVLAVDNFTGVEIAGRVLRVDHADNYRVQEEQGKSRGMDTTPLELNHDTSVGNNISPSANTGKETLSRGAGKETRSADALREKRVLERLRAMRRSAVLKQAGAHDAAKPYSTDHDITQETVAPENESAKKSLMEAAGNEEKIAVVEFAAAAAKAEKRRRREEKAHRKLERARIRELRQQRREER